MLRNGILQKSEKALGWYPPQSTFPLLGRCLWRQNPVILKMRFDWLALFLGPRLKETIMGKQNVDASERSLAEIENDLVKAETAYADADRRMMHAKRERQTALEAINGHQAELDAALAALRQRSTPGSRWRPNDQPEEVLSLGSENELSESFEDVEQRTSSLSTPTVKSVSAHFDRLKFHAEQSDREQQPSTLRRSSN